MYQVGPEGFCFLCNEAYVNKPGKDSHWERLHKGDPMKNAHKLAGGYNKTPEYLAWHNAHKSQTQKDLDSVLGMLDGNTPRHKIANFIREYLIEKPL